MILKGPDIEISGRGRLREALFSRGSNCSDFAAKMLVFWISGSLCQLVAYER